MSLVASFAVGVLIVSRPVLLVADEPPVPRILPVGDSITAGATAGPNSVAYNRGGYRYFLERFLEGSQGGAAQFTTKGPTGNAGGTIAADAGKWYSNGARPLRHPAHGGFPGFSIEQIDSMVEDDTIDVGDGDVMLLQIGTNNVGTAAVEPVLAATPGEIASWKAAYQDLLDRILAKSGTLKVVMAQIPPFTDGTVLGRLAANELRIEPFNRQVVEALYRTYSAAHPGRFFLVDNYSPLDPLNVAEDFNTATNDTDYLTFSGTDGVHPYNAGHRKMAVNFWRGFQLAQGAVAADLITVHDGDGADAGIRAQGTAPDGTSESTQPFVRSSANPAERGKYYIRLDLGGRRMDWQEAGFHLVFWGAPAAPAAFGNCCDDAPAAATLRLYGIPDGNDDWNETDITWANAPGNDPDGDFVDGILLGEFVLPAGAQSGDVISLESEALLDFVNHGRGADGKLTFVVTGDGTDPGFFATFQDSDWRDYASGFLTTRVTSVPRVLAIGDSLTAGDFGGPNSVEHGFGGYRYFLERFLEGSEGGGDFFQSTGPVTDRAGTVASFAGQWFANGPRPLRHPLHAGFSGFSIEQIDALVADGTIDVAGGDVILLQVGTINVGTSPVEPVLAATPGEIASWTAAYQSLLDRILAASATTRVVMAKIPPFTDGTVGGRLAANQLRIEPFNQLVVEALHEAYAAAYPGRLFLVDNYSPLDPLNVAEDFESATNDTDYMTLSGTDGVHPYHAGHRKMAANFWKGFQLAHGMAAADLITVHDGDGADAGIRGSGSAPDGGGYDRQPFVRSSANAAERGKYWIRLDLAGRPKNWDDAGFHLVFWGAPQDEASFVNCCDDAPAAVTLRLYGIPDGNDDWSETDITWSNAPGNDPDGDLADGILLGGFTLPAGARTGDVIRVGGEALRDFVNFGRGLDGKLTFVVTGDGEDPGFFPSFQDSDWRDYASSFLTLTSATVAEADPGFRIEAVDFDFESAPLPRATLTFPTVEGGRYLVSGSADLVNFDLVLASGIEGQPDGTSATVSVDLPLPMPPRLFLRVEKQ